ncbi:NAD-dependent epimerase/dehydratase family protein [Chromobacterium violaceum]|uniref:dTDP-glucose 4,6-dehydratase n=1 Tax=Chromobacterium violaceum TaxID=536 RepID=A0AAX2MFB8_CHRVL|nr:NAD-dependent epimerase/dehydratase family protein [Chromobacterium violaceum]ATP27599.1 protein CapI [Chromobacterium violaceum]ATP31513.1 protein CapI [Chromobacterium violaceum]OLZ87554.1 protein CapI [Chromobacterium violaceum]STB69306.1 dTDP-glucose 4,6-dehydratase [Chromobacterium violaceum]SUY93431.1 dTDP-glucose 4,6-dehydratase [Chromobacterium violaceum]
MTKILVTGAAGFIGRAVCEKLLEWKNVQVVGIDNLNDYYAVELKHARLATLQGRSDFSFYRQDIADWPAMEQLFSAEKFDYVIHLAAQAGVRYSLQNPHAYAESNLLGFTNVLEACRRHPVKHLVFAGSSSVYGSGSAVPFSEDQRADHPVSFYAATKRANELMAASYSHLYRLPTTSLRFFTVYGPWGRPDMAPWLFTDAILNGRPIKVFNHGKMQRDFTYIDDIVEGVVRVMEHVPSGELPHTIFNIGNHQPVELMTFIQLTEKYCGREAIKEYLPMQDGDVPITYAETSRLRDAVGFTPSTSLEVGMARFVEWFRRYHAV